MTLVTFILAAATAAYPRWIELVFGIDPDQGNGTLEALIVLVCILVAVTQAVRLIRAR
jgi:hypothetical protein